MGATLASQRPARAPPRPPPEAVAESLPEGVRDLPRYLSSQADGQASSTDLSDLQAMTSQMSELDVPPGVDIEQACSMAADATSFTPEPVQRRSEPADGGAVSSEAGAPQAEAGVVPLGEQAGPQAEGEELSLIHI